MGFVSFLLVAITPVLQFLLIGSLGAFLATRNSQVFSASTRREINKIVFNVFTPSLMFASLAKTVTFEELISWWFMPVNIAMTFFLGTILGWVVVKIFRPPCHLEGLIVANCSAGNLGNLLLLIIPTLCSEEGSPFAAQSNCSERGLSYVSLSMALGGIFIWTHTYSLLKGDFVKYEMIKKEELPEVIIEENSNICLMDQPGSYEERGEENEEDDGVLSLPKSADASTIMEPLLSSGNQNKNQLFCNKVMETLHHLAKELMEPPTIAAISGFVVGAIPWLKSLIIGNTAPLRVFQESLELLGNGTVPSITLILGGNLIEGLKKSTVRPSIILAILLVRYVALPIVGIVVVKAASALHFLPNDPLFSYVLLTQFSLPSAMSIGVMAQLFGVGQQECSVIFLWIYLVAALALTVWSTIFMYILA